MYTARRTAFGAQRDSHARHSDRQANINVVLFVLALGVFGGAIWQRSAPLLWLSALPAAAFIASFVWHGRINRLRDQAAVRWALNSEGLWRLHRDWVNLPDPKPTEGGDLAGDLDLLGHASLQHLLDTTSTPVGHATLRRWLLAPAAPETIAARHAAVRELAPQIELRETLAAQGRAMRGDQSQYEQLLRWAEGPPWLAQRSWLLWLARLLPIAIAALFVAQLLGWLGGPLWLAGLLVGLLVTMLVGREINARLMQVATRQHVFHAYAALFHIFTSAAFEAPELVRLQQRLTASGLQADAQMRRLARRLPLIDIRGWILFAPVQYATLWDVHVLWLLERWQRDAGAHARAWLGSLGELEALCALATLCFDQPEWAFPKVAADQRHYVARAIGHPLLPPTRCVRNDVTVGPPGSFLLVTGSNMSGKSTLLRALGVNIVLAQIGAPVCATAFSLPPTALATSMRVQDSLEAGVSYFMAELQRLKAVVDASERAQRTGQRQAFFLLDEILHGTNTHERQVAARHIISYLLALGATGAVSTHDLTLADTPELAAASVPVHFTETLARADGAPKLTFDYRLRPGIATSTNALALVELVGLPVPADTHQTTHTP